MRVIGTIIINDKNENGTQHYIKTMLKLVLNRNFQLACCADCPADNHARQPALFLYETLCVISPRTPKIN